jgi:hypothetical protein
VLASDAPAPAVKRPRGSLASPPGRPHLKYSTVRLYLKQAARFFPRYDMHGMVTPPMNSTLTLHETEALRGMVDASGPLTGPVAVGCSLPTLRAALRGATLAGVTRTAILSALTTPEARAA